MKLHEMYEKYDLFIFIFTLFSKQKNIIKFIYFLSIEKSKGVYVII